MTGSAMASSFSFGLAAVQDERYLGNRRINHRQSGRMEVSHRSGNSPTIPFVSFVFPFAYKPKDMVIVVNVSIFLGVVPSILP